MSVRKRPHQEKESGQKLAPSLFGNRPPPPKRNSPFIAIRDITKVYQMGEHEVHALKGVSLDIDEGEILAIMGPSGSGKSTIMNILGALDQLTGGSYLLDGTDVSHLSDNDLAEFRNHKVGFVFQNFSLLGRTSALRQVELPLTYAGMSRQERTLRARRALEMVGLGDRLNHKPNELSGGQQQRVAIARALVNEPSIILADEPTGNLDSKSGTEVIQVIQQLNQEQGITVILVTHDRWVARHTRRVVILADGLTVADERIAEQFLAGKLARPPEMDLK